MFDYFSRATGSAKEWLVLLRPLDWSKNLVVIAPVFMTPISNWAAASASIFAAFLAFCLVSSAGYIVNDLVDAEADRFHPVKRYRPLASRAIPATNASIVAVVLIVLGVGVSSLTTDRAVIFFVLAYTATSLSYSLLLKTVPVLELAAVSAGFPLRLGAGAVALTVLPSAWALACVSSAALLVVVTKRRMERLRLGEESHATRAVMSFYSSALLRWFQLFFLMCTVAVFLIFLSSDTAGHRYRTEILAFAVIPIFLAMVRFITLADRAQTDVSTTKLLTGDWFVVASSIITAGIFYKALTA
ncbi:hypothetical protein EOI86_06880 [Hwanghaeella grinnelliae]|uniref:Decaprenyl-phosphate phosphoribosyltransferase n=1 Tax=Hwanghaeella grinnelliae TaxID=2500179 RepID=A0A437QWY8_9PROT|nr:UbiA family prenyltransferase [Hwanghaeella grinnelliae]RVU38979.1 hypothetical protein EOI86_06880 [Hwanghaeella grinnelliae]